MTGYVETLKSQTWEFLKSNSERGNRQDLYRVTLNQAPCMGKEMKATSIVSVTAPSSAHEPVPSARIS